jgi:phosphatidylglycerol:prolipoprotein diacylglycerol transferase
VIPPAVIVLSFDPTIEVADLVIRWQTIGVTVALLLGLATAAIYGAGILRPARDNALRLDDMVYMILGVVPGAVVGGRIVHGLVFWESYAADPLRLFDVSAGSLSLTGAVVGGTISGAYMARLIGAPARRWADAAVVSVLLILGLGKLAQVLGGSGQGSAFDGAWALAFGPPGPWVSPLPAVPAHPSQVYEGLWLLAALPVAVLWIRRNHALRPLAAGQAVPLDRGGGLFVAFLLWFLLGRVVVGFSWRDDLILGPFNAEQVIALLLMATVVAVALYVRGRSIVKPKTSMTPREGNA